MKKLLLTLTFTLLILISKGQSPTFMGSQHQDTPFNIDYSKLSSSTTPIPEAAIDKNKQYERDLKDRILKLLMQPIDSDFSMSLSKLYEDLQNCRSYCMKDVDVNNADINKIMSCWSSRLYQIEQGIDDANFKYVIRQKNKSNLATPQTEKECYDKAMNDYNSGKYYDVISDCNKIIEANPKNANAYHLRSKAKLWVGDFTGGSHDGDRAIVLGYKP